MGSFPKILEISFGIQMERSVSASSDRNIRDHLWRWSTYFGWNILIESHLSIFDKPVLCPHQGIRIFPLISDQSVWYNGKHPIVIMTEKITPF